VALIFCMAAFNKVVTLLPATAAAISTLAIPIVGLLSSAWLLGEPAGWRELAALCLVLGGMALVLVPRRQARTS
jgi:drug/metabolite transporter (DMT)-like permease